MIRAAVLTISDSSYAAMRADRSGPAVVEILAKIGAENVLCAVLPDERPVIAARLAELADSGDYDIILTTGGTGITERDVTPEATRDILQREIPGLGEAMRAAGLKSTPRAALSRAVAGHRSRTLVVNLPGSPKGAVESLSAIVGLIPHMVDLLQGRTEHQP